RHAPVLRAATRPGWAGEVRSALAVVVAPAAGAAPTGAATAAGALAARRAGARRDDERHLGADLDLGTAARVGADDGPGRPLVRLLGLRATGVEPGTAERRLRLLQGHAHEVRRDGGRLGRARDRDVDGDLRALRHAPGVGPLRDDLAFGLVGLDLVDDRLETEVGDRLLGRRALTAHEVGERDQARRRVQRDGRPGGDGLAGRGVGARDSVLRDVLRVLGPAGRDGEALTLEDLPRLVLGLALDVLDHDGVGPGREEGRDGRAELRLGAARGVRPGERPLGLRRLLVEGLGVLEPGVGYRLLRLLGRDGRGERGDRAGGGLVRTLVGDDDHRDDRGEGEHADRDEGPHEALAALRLLLVLPGRLLAGRDGGRRAR